MAGSSQDPTAPHRRRRRAARRAAGPPAQASTAPMADPERAADQESLTDPARAAIPAGPGDTGTGLAADAGSAVIEALIADPLAAPHVVPAHHPDAAGSAEVVHGSPGSAPAGPGHSHAGSPGNGPAHPTAPHRDRPDRAGSASGEAPRRSGRSSREESAERSLRSLVTTRSSQVSPTAALRAREVALPSADDLAAAERDLVIVRRHYVPPTALSTGRRQEWPNKRGSAGGSSGAGGAGAGSKPGAGGSGS